MELAEKEVNITKFLSHNGEYPHFRHVRKPNLGAKIGQKCPPWVCQSIWGRDIGGNGEEKEKKNKSVAATSQTCG